MKEENLFLLLDVIFRNGSVKRLTRNNIDFNEIAKQTNIAINQGLLNYIENQIALTKEGVKVYQKLEAQYKKTNKSEWIEKDLKNQIASKDKNFIFMPRQNELSF